MTVQHMVVGIDGSDASARAARWSAMLAKTTGAKVTAVHAIPSSEWPVAINSSLSMMSQDAYDSWRNDLAHAFNTEWCAPLTDAGIRFETVFRNGYAPQVLFETATTQGADLIVVGNRGRGGFSELLLGSVGHAVSHQAPVPVAIVRGDHEHLKAPRLIVVGMDDSADAINACAWAADLAAESGADLLIVSSIPEVVGQMAIYPVDVQAELDEMRNRITAAIDGLIPSNVQHSLELVVGNPAAMLNHLAEERHADLIVVGQCGHRVAERLMLGSVSHQLAHHSQVPLVVIRPQAVPAAAQTAPAEHAVPAAPH